MFGLKKKKLSKEQLVNSLEDYIEEVTIVLPNSKEEVSLSDLIHNADKDAMKKKDDDEMDNEKHDDDEMDNEDDDEMDNEDDDDEKENEDDYDDEDEMKKNKKKKNKMKKNMGKKHKNSADDFRSIVKEELGKLFSESSNFDKLSNAHTKKKLKNSGSSLDYMTKAEQVARGKENY